MTCSTRVRTWMASVLALVGLLLGGAAPAAANIIYVTTLQQKVGGRVPGCSLQEAIFAANLDASIATVYSVGGQTGTVTTSCLPGKGDDIIILPLGGTLQMDAVVDDAINPFGPTATPLVTSGIVIEGYGATLMHGGPTAARAFAVGNGGRLTLRQMTIRGFLARGGDGGFGGGGGLGAGGAVYVGGGQLLVEHSTFVGNIAMGGNGAGSSGAENTFGGGGGMGGHGRPDGEFIICEGGLGGGGSRGNGFGACVGTGNDAHGGGGGGTLRPARSRIGGIACGGNGGVGSTGGTATCAGGGGGGGGTTILTSSDGGHGDYGGGGGAGGRHGGHGGNGGFGGGGGAGWGDNVFGADGGDGGFGGGGGSSGYGTLNDGGSGSAGMFGGGGRRGTGGGGAGLGGAIFNHAGVVTVRNSTFTGNVAVRGVGGGNSAAPNGNDRGAGLFSVDGELNVTHSTIASNNGTGFGAGLVAIQWRGRAVLRLYNSIIADNGAAECSLAGSIAVDMRGNLIGQNDNCLGIVATANPLLGPLQMNGGRTATMRIPRTSPAFNTADPNVALSRDQRGQDRPAEGGYDIGAFELCVFGPPVMQMDCPIVGGVSTDDPVVLTMVANPSVGGTTTPPVGATSVNRHTVVIISAAAAPGYSFTGWSGGVTDPSALTTTVVMDMAKTVTANFTPPPNFNIGPVNTATMVPNETEPRTIPVTANLSFSAPVTFSTLNVPAGVTMNYLTPSVTPPFGGTVNGQVDITTGPTVLAGSYTMTIRGTSGALVRTTPFTLNIAMTAASLGKALSFYEKFGCIADHAVTVSYQTALSQAQVAIDRRDYKRAAAILAALLKQIDAHTGRQLSTSCSNGLGGTFNAAKTLYANVLFLGNSLGTVPTK